MSPSRTPPFDSYTMHKYSAYQRSSNPFACVIYIVCMIRIYGWRNGTSMSPNFLLPWRRWSCVIETRWMERITYSTFSIGRVKRRVSPNNISSCICRIKFRSSTCSIFVAAARRRQTVNSTTRYSFPSRLVSKMMWRYLTWKSNVIMSSKPSVMLGFLKREA